MTTQGRNRRRRQRTSPPRETLARSTSHSPSPSSAARRPVTVAITGGIGAGKSEALAAFGRHGAAVLSSDAIVHRLYEENDEVRAAVRDRWGDDVLDADGRVDRPAVGRRVFGDPAELKWLEALLHPLVKSESDRWFEEQLALPKPPTIVVSEIPLLYETDGEKRFDKVVVITAPAEVREARRGPTADREANLLPEESKIAAADYVFENAGSLEELDRFVAAIVEELSRS